MAMNKPSVTELLDILAKPALISWANKQGLKGIDLKDFRKKALSKGTSIHAQIEGVYKGTAKFEKQDDAIKFEKFMLDKSLMGSEIDIETDWFVGRYDARIEHLGNEYIVDFKRGFKGKIYLENKLQLIAYTMAEPAAMAIVGTKDFKMVPVVIADRRPYEEILKSLSKIWYLQKEIGNEVTRL